MRRADRAQQTKRRPHLRRPGPRHRLEHHPPTRVGIKSLPGAALGPVTQARHGAEARWQAHATRVDTSGTEIATTHSIRWHLPARPLGTYQWNPISNTPCIAWPTTQPLPPCTSSIACRRYSPAKPIVTVFDTQPSTPSAARIWAP